MNVKKNWTMSIFGICIGGGGRNPIPSDEWGSDLPSQHGGGLDPPSDLKTVRGWENLALWMVKEPDIRPKLLENT